MNQALEWSKLLEVADGPRDQQELSLALEADLREALDELLLEELEAEPALLHGREYAVKQEPGSPAEPVSLRELGRLQINNVTSTFTVRGRRPPGGRRWIGQKVLDLDMLARNLGNVQYRPQKFSAVITRQREPNTTALLFSTGKCVVTGAKSIEESYRAALKFTGKIARHHPGIKLRVTDSQVKGFEVQNIAASFTMQHVFKNMAAAKFKLAPWLSVCFEPELFPAMIVSIKQPPPNLRQVRFLAYRTGKVVLTGCKDEQTVGEAFDLAYPLFAQCQTACPESEGRRDQADAQSAQRRGRAAAMIRHIKYDEPIPKEFCILKQEPRDAAARVRGKRISPGLV